MFGAGSWKLKFIRGYINDLLRFFLRVARHITTLEMEGSLHWMSGTNVPGMFPTLHTLKLVGIVNTSLPRACCYFIRLTTLRTLQLVRMEVTSGTFSHLGIAELFIISLQFVDCLATTNDLSKADRACRELETFTYRLSARLWTFTMQQYDIAELIYHLRKHHKSTLKHLTILTMGVQVRDRCHYADDLSQFKVLLSLIINHDHLHPRHFGITPKQCQMRRLQQQYLLTSLDQNPKSVVELLLLLAPSLQRLELHVCEKTQMTRDLLNVMYHMVTNGLLPDLRNIKVIFEHARSFLTRDEKDQLAALTAQLCGLGREQAL